MCMIGDFEELTQIRKEYPILAYRAWVGRDPNLYSTSFGPDRPWPRTKLKHADCIPTAEPTHGVWAFMAPEERNFYFVGNHTVLGTVLLWGTVAVHARGYRAEYAKIFSLTEFNNHDKVSTIAAHYNVPIFPASL